MAKGKPRSMNKPAMMDWALRLLRLLIERKGLPSRIVAIDRRNIIPSGGS
jgi:hypothetical protein